MAQLSKDCERERKDREAHSTALFFLLFFTSRLADEIVEVLEEAWHAFAIVVIFCKLFALNFFLEIDMQNLLLVLEKEQQKSIRNLCFPRKNSKNRSVILHVEQDFYHFFFQAMIWFAKVVHIRKNAAFFFYFLTFWQLALFKHAQDQRDRSTTVSWYKHCVRLVYSRPALQ